MPNGLAGLTMPNGLAGLRHANVGAPAECKLDNDSPVKWLAPNPAQAATI